MRLKKVETGHSLFYRFIIAFETWKTGHRFPDVARTILYRTKFWGAPYSAVIEKVMRGPSTWSVGEREAMAAFTSSLNGCVY